MAFDSMSRDEIRALLAAIDNSRQRCMVLLTFWHGFRVSEVVGGWSKVKGKKVYHEPLKPANFNVTHTTDADGNPVKNIYVTVQRLKGSKKTCQKLFVHEDPLLNERDQIDLVLADTKPDEPLFPLTRFGFYKLIRRYGAKAGIPRHKCHPHALKHSIGKQSAKAGAGVENIRTWLGHKSYVTMEYMRSDEDEAQQAISAAVGGGL